MNASNDQVSTDPSLPVALSDQDDGSEEARRRVEEMKRDPSSRRTWEQIKEELGR